MKLLALDFFLVNLDRLLTLPPHPGCPFFSFFFFFWPDNHAQLHPQLCVGPQQTLLFISLIGHIWTHYLHLWGVQARARGRGQDTGGQGCSFAPEVRWCWM